MWKEIATIIHMDPENSDLSDPEFWQAVVWLLTRVVCMLRDELLE